MTERRNPRDLAPGRLRVLQLFLNTNDIEAGVDHLATPEEASRWLTSHDLTSEKSVIGSRRDLQRLVDLREGTRALVSARDGTPMKDEDLGRLTSALAGCTASIQFEASGTARLVSTSDGFDEVLILLASIVHEAKSTGLWARLKVCSNDGCRWAFWDSSRNHSGRWCSMAICGNQAKVRAHRERKSGTTRSRR